jgi:deazaflavin-dependent oxidoreductase (nitroreductase family)
VRQLLFRIYTTLHMTVLRASQFRLLGVIDTLPVLILTTTGSLTGKPRETPLMALETPDGPVVIASAGGHARDPIWCRNLLKNPEVRVETAAGTRAARAEVLTGERRAALWSQLIARATRYETYQKATTREIPLVLLRAA